MSTKDKPVDVENNIKVCTKCGHMNSSENRFCESCGQELDEAIQEKAEEADTITESEQPPVPEKKSKKKKIIIILIIAVLVMAGAAVAVVKYMDSRTGAEYNAKITEADKYMQELDYEKAEASYLAAIEIEPKADKAYLKLADTYATQEKYTEAIDILEKGAENAGGKKIKKKYRQIYPYQAYDDFLKNELAESEGLAADTADTDHPEGLLSAVIEDVDKDDIPELITFYISDYEDDNRSDSYVKTIISLYECDDKEVTLAAEEEHIGKGSYDDNKGTAFKKWCGDKLYIGFLDTCQTNNGNGRYAWVYSINGSSIDLEDFYSIESHTAPSNISFSFILNDNEVANYDSGNTGTEENIYDESSAEYSKYHAESERGYDVFTQALKKYGLEHLCKSHKIAAYMEYEPADESEETIFTYEYEMGMFMGDGMTLTVEDNTGMIERIR